MENAVKVEGAGACAAADNLLKSASSAPDKEYARQEATRASSYIRDVAADAKRPNPYVGSEHRNLASIGAVNGRDETAGGACMITLEDFNRVRHRQITQIHERAITPTDDKVGQIIFEMSNLAVQDSRNAAVGEPWSMFPYMWRRSIPEWARLRALLHTLRLLCMPIPSSR